MIETVQTSTHGQYFEQNKYMKNISIFHLKKFHFKDIKIAVYYIVPALANVYGFLYSMHVHLYEYIHANNVLMFKKQQSLCD